MEKTGRCIQMNIRLSIVIPAYNCENYICDCIDSILTVEANDFEVLVIDDGSTDSTPDRLAHYNDVRLRIYSQENGGASRARNRGIELASGQYVMFVDADDLLRAGWYQTIERRLEKAPDIAIFAKGTKDKAYGKLDLVLSAIGVLGIPELKWLPSPWSKVYKTDYLLTKELRFNENIVNGEDALFNLEALLRTDNILICDASFYSYRIHQESATYRYRDGFLRSNEEYLAALVRLLRECEGDQVTADEIVDCLFCRSVSILAVRIARIRGWHSRASAIEDAYRDESFSKRLGTTEVNSSLNTKEERVIYWLTKHKLLWASVLAIRFVMKNKSSSDQEMWVTI